MVYGEKSQQRVETDEFSTPCRGSYFSVSKDMVTGNLFSARVPSSGALSLLFRNLLTDMKKQESVVN